MKNTAFLILFLLLCTLTAKAQTRAVYGRVTVLNNLPVSGIKVKAMKSNATAVTDSTGVFSIVCQEKDRLKFCGKVFRPAYVKINGGTGDSVSVRMNFLPAEKNAELAVGYGYISEQYRTEVIQYLQKGHDFSRYNNIYDIIRQNFNNVTVNNNGCVIIRGIGTINGSNCALYVVDGTIVDNIGYIQPSDVKEISLLKDAASASIYGNEGAQGVILINLKNGK